MQLGLRVQGAGLGLGAHPKQPPHLSQTRCPHGSISTSSTQSRQRVVPVGQRGPKRQEAGEELRGQRLIEKEAMESGKVRQGCTAGGGVGWGGLLLGGPQEELMPLLPRSLCERGAAVIGVQGLAVQGAVGCQAMPGGDGPCCRQVKLSVYMQYLRAIGWGFSTCVFLSYVVQYAAFMGSNLWLSDWTNDALRYQNQTYPAAQRDLRIGVFGALGMAQGEPGAVGG